MIDVQMWTARMMETVFRTNPKLEICLVTQGQVDLRINGRLMSIGTQRFRLIS